MKEPVGPVTFKDWVEGFGYRVVRVEVEAGLAPVVVCRESCIWREKKHDHVDRKRPVDSWVVFEEDDMKRWVFVVTDESHRPKPATWADLERWNRDVREFGGKQGEMAL